MRERADIEREIFAARQDLEENLDQLIHRARETFQVRARAEHAVRETASEHRVLIAITAVSVVACVVALVMLRRARR